MRQLLGFVSISSTQHLKDISLLHRSSSAIMAPPRPASATVCLPIKLDAFIVTEDFPESQYRIAPLIQPNYAALRADTGHIEHDVLDELNLSSVALTAKCNTRFMDVTTGQVRRDRLGVYLSWCLPRTYRAGIVASETAAEDHSDAMLKRGYSPAQTEQGSRDSLLIATEVKGATSLQVSKISAVL